MFSLLLTCRTNCRVIGVAGDLRRAKHMWRHCNVLTLGIGDFAERKLKLMKMMMKLVKIMMMMMMMLMMMMMMKRRRRRMSSRRGRRTVYYSRYSYTDAWFYHLRRNISKQNNKLSVFAIDPWRWFADIYLKNAIINTLYEASCPSFFLSFVLFVLFFFNINFAYNTYILTTSPYACNSYNF